MTQSFNELVEARAKAIYEHNLWNSQCPSIPGSYRGQAREQLILEYARKHPHALEELIMGRAAVIPVEPSKEIIEEICCSMDRADWNVHAEQAYKATITTGRLDREPMETNTTIQEIPTAGEGK